MPSEPKNSDDDEEGDCGGHAVRAKEPDGRREPLTPEPAEHLLRAVRKHHEAEGQSQDKLPGGVVGVKYFFETHGLRPPVQFQVRWMQTTNSPSLAARAWRSMREAISCPGATIALAPLRAAAVKQGRAPPDAGDRR